MFALVPRPWELPIVESGYAQYPGWLHDGKVITKDAARFSREADLIYVRYGEGGPVLLRKQGPVRPDRLRWWEDR